MVLSVIIGVTFFAESRGRGFFALTMLLAVYFLVEGLANVIFPLTIRPFPDWDLGFCQWPCWNYCGDLPEEQPFRTRRSGF